MTTEILGESDTVKVSLNNIPATLLFMKFLALLAALNNES